jgi:hypothetical protein
MFCFCWYKGSSASELSSTDVRPSTTTGHTVTVGSIQSSQDRPTEAKETGASNEESREHNANTNVADSEVGAAVIGVDSQESQSDPFSAAAEHCLMDALDHADENTQSTRATL